MISIYSSLHSRINISIILFLTLLLLYIINYFYYLYPIDPLPIAVSNNDFPQTRWGNSCCDVVLSASWFQLVMLGATLWKYCCLFALYVWHSVGQLGIIAWTGSIQFSFNRLWTAEGPKEGSRLVTLHMVAQNRTTIDNYYGYTLNLLFSLLYIFSQ